jgi:hypothetical protein
MSKHVSHLVSIVIIQLATLSVAAAADDDR